MRENLYLNHVVPECQITKSTKIRGINANIDLKKKKYSSELMRTVVFLKESEPKQTEVAKWYQHDVH